MKWTERQITDAHNHCFENVQEIQASDQCVCYYCAANNLPNAYFPPEAVVEWLNPAGIVGNSTAEAFTCDLGPLSNRATAFCPNCTFDMVIGDASGLPIADLAFIVAINDRF